jgi:hypothetical protein
MFTALFVRDVERVTLKIVLAAAMIVGGVALLTLWKWMKRATTMRRVR